MGGDVIVAGWLLYWAAASWEVYSAAVFVGASCSALSRRAFSRYPAESRQKVSELSYELFRLWSHLIGTVLQQVVSFLLPASLPRSYSA